jgi:hypothetical protein
MITSVQEQGKLNSSSRPSFTPVFPGLLQRRCGCGVTPGMTGECEDCRNKRLNIQKKLTINRPGDKDEQEADHMAEQVMRMPVQTEASRNSDTTIKSSPVPPIVHEVRRSSGQPLDPATRTFMESRFGHDFSRVRVHTDENAMESARVLNALAYTVDKDVIFGSGQYLPKTRKGLGLVTHELVHVIQQERGGLSSPISSVVHEDEATEIAAELTRGITEVAVNKVACTSIARENGKPMTAAHAGGEMGERDAAFALGKMGFDIIVGPGGEKGHKLTASGFDIIAFNPKTRELWIVDNKSSGGLRNVKDASALTTNVIVNLKLTIAEVQKLPNFPNKSLVISNLNASLTALQSGTAIPKDVSLVVTNAGGYATGIAKKLHGQGVRFVDVVGKDILETRAADMAAAKKTGVKPSRPVTHPKEETKKVATPKVDVTNTKNTEFKTKGKVIYYDPSRGSRKPPTISGPGRSRPAMKGAALAEFLPAAMNVLQDIGIRHSVAVNMLSQWTTVENWRRKHPDHYILAVVSLREWEYPDPAGNVARMVNYVHFFHGATPDDAIVEANKVLRVGIPKGWREVGPFMGWIKPHEPLADIKEQIEKQEACFIATACYGSSIAPHVLVLREFRDAVLQRSRLGRKFVKVYYRWSPPLAQFLTEHNGLRSLVRTGIVTPLGSLISITRVVWRRVSLASLSRMDRAQ